MPSKSCLRLPSLVIFAGAFSLTAAASEFQASDILNAAMKNAGRSEKIAGTAVSAASKAAKKETTVIPGLEHLVFESLRDYFSQEDEGRSCGIKKGDVWGHEAANVAYEGTRIVGADVNTLVDGWTGNCAGRMRFSCTTTLVRKKGKLLAETSECSEDE